MAVMALAAYAPKADMVFISACIPAPPLQSEPAIVSTHGYFFVVILILFLCLMKKCGEFKTHDSNANVKKISNTSFFIFYFFG